MRGGPEFSIIIPVFHRGEFLRRALSSLRGMDFPRGGFEVLVAGEIGDLESRAIVESEAGEARCDVIYVGSDGGNRARMLNAACAGARGRILAFSDDDCIFRPDWLKRLDEAFNRKPAPGAVGGADELEGADSALGMALDRVLNSFLGTGGLRRGEGPRTGKYYPKLWNMAVPRDAAFGVALRKESGPPQIFDETLGIYEDVDLCERVERAGKKIAFAPDLKVGHVRHVDFGTFIAGNIKRARTARSLGTHRAANSALSAFALGAPALALASFFSAPLKGLFLALMALYGLALLFAAAAGFLSTGRAGAALLIPVLMVSLHFSRGLAYLFPLRGAGGGRG